MQIKIDTKEKTIEVLDVTTLSELFEFLGGIKDWESYNLITTFKSQTVIGEMGQVITIIPPVTMPSPFDFQKVTCSNRPFDPHTDH